MIRVEEMMSREPVCATPGMSLREALEVCTEKRIRHLPVLENDKLVGVVSDRDLRHGSPSVYAGMMADQQVSEKELRPLMNTEPITIHPLAFVEEAAYTMYTLRIGCLPVVHKERVTGIVTKSDLMRTLIELMGIHEPSSYIKIDMLDRPTACVDIARILSGLHVDITNMYVSYDKKEQRKHLNLQLQTIDPRPIIQKINKSGYRVLWPQYNEEWL